MNRKKRRKEAARRERAGFTAPFPRITPLFDPNGVNHELAVRLLKQLLMGGGDADADTPAGQARALACDAMDASSPAERALLAMDALEIDQDCVDAHMVLADNLSTNGEEYIRRVRRAVQAAEHAFGPGALGELRGHCWGTEETRRYMMVLESLALALRSSGHIEDEMREYEEMLELNPNDNQGVRFNLLGRYLQCDDLPGARRLLERYACGCDAIFEWAKVLERWLSLDTEGASVALERAREDNRFVEPYLTGREKPPEHLPEHYSFGSREEAAVYMDEIGAAWTAHPDAVEWLKKAG